MADTSPLIYWVRRDFRTSDNPALAAAAATGRPVIPLFILDECVQTLGAAPKWRLGLAVEKFAQTLREMGSDLVLRRGGAVEVMGQLVQKTGAAGVYWSRAYDQESAKRDEAVEKYCAAKGLDVRCFPGHVLFEPASVKNASGSFFKVYTPFWQTVRTHDVGLPATKVRSLRPPCSWPESEKLDGWNMGRAMNRGAGVVLPYLAVGEAAAQKRLRRFLDRSIDRYRVERDHPSKSATSRLSENLTYGEISPRQIWYLGQEALKNGVAGAEHFLKELVWREFAYHLIYHTPQITTENWRVEWNNFPWRDDNSDALAWRMGMTGEPLVDAGMRELYVTGTMHNRLRMIVGSYLTKHLLTDWRIGRDWFADCLVDWDPAANAMGWQWIAGSGPDAAPYFRVFNPELQSAKFDADGSYRKRFLWAWNSSRSPEARAFFDAVPRSWVLSAHDDYPDRVVPLAEGRKRALAAYKAFRV